MKYAYWMLAIMSCAMGAAYYADGKTLLAVLWTLSGICDGIIAAMSD